MLGDWQVHGGWNCASRCGICSRVSRGEGARMQLSGAFVSFVPRECIWLSLFQANQSSHPQHSLDSVCWGVFIHFSPWQQEITLRGNKLPFRDGDASNESFWFFLSAVVLFPVEFLQAPDTGLVGLVGHVYTLLVPREKERRAFLYFLFSCHMPDVSLQKPVLSHILVTVATFDKRAYKYIFRLSFNKLLCTEWPSPASPGPHWYSESFVILEQIKETSCLFFLNIFRRNPLTEKSWIQVAMCGSCWVTTLKPLRGG